MNPKTKVFVLFPILVILLTITGILAWKFWGECLGQFSLPVCVFLLGK